MLLKRNTGGQLGHSYTSCLSGINQGAAQRFESRGRSQRFQKFSQTSTSQTQSKWLVQKSGSEEKGKLLGWSSSSSAHCLGYSEENNSIVTAKILFFLCLHTGYSLIILMLGSLIRTSAHQGTGGKGG